jgi:hypothetical protein
MLGRLMDRRLGARRPVECRCDRRSRRFAFSRCCRLGAVQSQDTIRKTAKDKHHPWTVNLAASRITCFAKGIARARRTVAPSHRTIVVNGQTRTDQQILTLTTSRISPSSRSAELVEQQQAMTARHRPENGDQAEEKQPPMDPLQGTKRAYWIRFGAGGKLAVQD